MAVDGKESDNSVEVTALAIHLLTVQRQRSEDSCPFGRNVFNSIKACLVISLRLFASEVQNLQHSLIAKP